MRKNAFFARQIYAEHLIAAGRVVLSTFSLLAVHFGTTEPSGYGKVVSPLLSGYLIYAAALAFVIWRLPKVRGPLPFITHVFDLAVFSLLMCFTTHPTSPFFIYFVFLVICATLRWQWRGTLWTAVAALAAFILLGKYTPEFQHDGAFRLNSFMIWGGYMAVVAALLGYLAIYQERGRSQISMLAAWSRDVPLEARDLVRGVLEYACGILHAPRVLMAWDEEKEPWVHLALWSPGEFYWSSEPAGALRLLVAKPLAGDDFVCTDLHAPVPKVLHTSSAGFKDRHGSPLHSDLQQRFDIKTVLALKLNGESLEGHLFFLDKQGLTSDDLLLGQVVAREVVARLDLFYSIQRLRQMAAAEARLHISHDLHDGLLQSLALVTMKLDRLNHMLDEEPSKAKELLLEIDRLLLDEQDGLRSFVRELKSASGGVPHREVSLIARLEGLVKQVERQWGLCVDLNIAGIDSKIPEALSPDIYYLFREALLNAARHAGASSVGTELRMGNHELRITVADNGRGFSFHGHYDHATLMQRELGPVTLKGRITSLGGTLSIESSEAGARLEITLPLPSSGA